MIVRLPMDEPGPAPKAPPMEIHKPKPGHSWRELATEIGVIVIGVAIALAAEQIVESLHWQHKIADARQAMMLELRDDDGPQAYIRLAIAPCIAKQLETLKSAIAGNASRADIERMTSNLQQGNVTWDTVAWTTLQTSDVASHM